MLDTVRQDLAFAIRNLLRGRMVSLVAVLSLAVGIGANTTVFSLVQALEFPNLIYPDASRIVFLETRNDRRGVSEMMMSAPDARDVAAASRALQAVSIAASQSSILRTGDSATRVQGRRVDPGFFDLLRVPPALGRAIGVGDQQGVIVLSDALWRSQFGADAAVVGRAIRLDGGTTTVVGVMPALFDGDADFWTPLAGAIDASPRDDRQFDLFARIAPGSSPAAVDAELSALSARLAADHPGTNRDWRLYATPLSRQHFRDAASSFLLLQAAVGFVLLIACANIANILLARGTERRREMAVRIALGASRRRLVATLLTEALVLSGTGGVLGVLLSMWGIRLARAFVEFPDVIEPHLNLPVLAFTAAVSVLTGVVCGLGPSLRASSVAPDPVLREAGRGTTDRSAARLRAGLVVTQVAAALMLATCATLLLRSVANRERVGLGFEPRSAFRADLALPPDRYADPSRVTQTVDRILVSIAAEPDVVAAGAKTWALPTGAGAERRFTLPEDGDRVAPVTRLGVEAVTPNYFTALGAAMKAGRGFTDGDRPGTAPVAIVNEELARRLWPDGRAIGRQLRLGLPSDRAPLVTIVGVVASMRRSPMHDTVVPTTYLPYAQYPNGTVTIVTRTRGDVEPGVRALHAAVRDADALLIAEGVKTLGADMAAFMAPLHFITSVLGAFALTAVLLSALGVFGTMSYSVVQREHEIAVRSALGAGHAAILRLIFASALRLTLAGVAIGAAAAVLAARALRGFLFGVTATDPATFATAAVALSLMAVAACWRPARRAATVDPMTLLRR
jgi:putative ABC transport system permease protein